MARKAKKPEQDTPNPEQEAAETKPEKEAPEKIEAGTDLTEEQRVTLRERANKILKKAREKGDEQALLFETIFQQYLETLDHRQKLRDAIVKDGMTVTKSYVKNRPNIYVHPALAAYASQGKLLLETAKTLMTLIREKIADEDDQDEFDLF
ncbi:MAG: hypothetical protein IKS55_02705 [Oscillospiraceae bacterium]|nr:hypothetical protein [Oscillospiraceae bacterium]